MPLCVVCKARAEVQPHRPGPLDPTYLPPYGMDWGDTCGACGRTAEVCIV